MTNEEIDDHNTAYCHSGLIDYIKRKLTIEHEESYHGFNGKHHEISLRFNGEVLSTIWLDIEKDEG